MPTAPRREASINHHQMEEEMKRTMIALAGIPAAAAITVAVAGPASAGRNNGIEILHRIGEQQPPG